MIKWCCKAFEGEYSAAGMRGTAIIVDRNDKGSPIFVVQHRIVDIDVNVEISSDEPATLISDMQIQFCPWCGRRLIKWYERNIDELVRPGYKIKC